MSADPIPPPPSDPTPSTPSPSTPALTPTPPAPTPEPETGLRDRLVRAGVELVDTEGVQALSLREIARRAGVSHGAPRRHFPTHLDLLSAIAREGFRELGARVARADEREGEARARIEALARTYLDFARTRGGMYELMFRHDLLESGRLGLRDTSLPLFARFGALVAEARPDAAPATAAGALWANLHGIAQLWRWGSLRLATGADDVEPLLAAALRAHLGPAGETR
ncbi:TetR/AcrR family transcriptional regulator [Streptomyces sp. NBC_01268]|uniref:TetR/AcrR family transcriptional regulator n=1 Tax=Streptomyces sp. NBC_01268 TaxID=2903806 RepID=UPI002E33D8E5|nr:TetR/AcrR family transcriptional regulator [Streptomyces sp. NBC_01268]